MTALATFEKQPADVQDYDIDYSDYLDDLSDVAATVDLVGVDIDGPVLTDPLVVTSVSIVGQFVKVWCSGGVDGQKYTVTVILTTTGGRRKEAEITIKVKDKRGA